ncbi:hypothetical protein FVE67_02655 [Thermosulfurimonas marina]|uniref:Cell division protein FtsL n=1 Tax=Thermosulfurimonas marina TaxID=2047767 RepID=A0A6H1WRI1_9BACT|nr:hypothetical protein [Thermosulfurimonas marina]QJA05764.1 hypothetical protein FVE67_02655 [Thermosulfurimonas marina]
MRALSAGYPYQPRARTRSRGLSLRGVLLLALGLLLALPWLLAGVRLYQWQGVHRSRKAEEAHRARLLKTWEALTAEEVVRQKVAPLGLHKPTEKEMVRLP